MTRRELACAIAEAHADDADLVVNVTTLGDGVVTLLRGMEETAFRVLAECQEESEESAIGWSKDRSLWCVLCPEPAARTAILCRIAEELHLYDGLDSPLAKDAGIHVADQANGTIAEFARK